MNDLIEKWEKLADRYFEQARGHSHDMTAERLFSAAETYSICADQLKRKLKEVE